MLGGWATAGGDRGAGEYFVAWGQDGASGGRKSVRVFGLGLGVLGGGAT